MAKNKKTEIKKTKGFVNLVIDTDTLHNFKLKCKEKGIREQHKEKEILESGMNEFIKTHGGVSDEKGCTEV